MSFSLFAQESIFVTEYSGKDLAFATSVSAEFEINAELSRAWVVTSPIIYDEGAEADKREVVLSQLSYDQASKSVVYRSNGFEVVCAKLKTTGRGIFKNSYLVKTGKCQFSQKNGSRIVDPGTNPYKLETIEVYLNVKK